MNEITIDYSIDIQEYIEDCTVCCRPMTLTITIAKDRYSMVDVRGDND